MPLPCQKSPISPPRLLFASAVLLLVLAQASAAFPLPAQTAKPRPNLDPVVQALREKRFDAALQLLKVAQDTSPWDPRVWTLEGLAHTGAGRTDDSLASYQKALALAPDYLPALLGVAEIEFRRRDANARLRLERVLALQPGNPTAHAMLGILDYERDDCSSAARHFDQCRKYLEQDRFGLGPYGECLIRVRRPAEAVDIFRGLFRDNPERQQVRYALAVALYESGHYAEVADLLRPLAEAPVPDSAVLGLLADAYEGDHRTPEALETLKKAVRLYLREERHYVDLANLCLEHGAYDLGLEVLDAGVKNLHESAAIRAMQGVIQAQLGRFAEAEAAFEHAARLDPAARSAQIGRMLTLQETGRLEESIGALRQQLREEPDDPSLNFMLAQALIRKGVEPGHHEFQEAISALEKAIKGDPLQAPSYVELGKLHLKAGAPVKAAERLREALKLAPGDRTATYQLMLALRRLGRPQEAQALMDNLRGQLQKGMEDDVRTGRYRLLKSNRTVPDQP